MIAPPTQEQILQLIREGLAEDVGSGDVTTDSILREDVVTTAQMTAKETLVICGLEVARTLFSYLDPEAVFSDRGHRDGDEISSGETLISIEGKASALLKGERLALNILQQLSGISTLTRKFVQAAGNLTILDTRKTTPCLRHFEKYAVKCGGGENHRFGLFDAVLIKDNHIKIAGGIGCAVQRVRENSGYQGTIEVETTNLTEVQEAVDSGADIIMLDNMDNETLRKAVEKIAGRAKTEISGSITLDRLKEIEGTGADYVSVGALTHSAPAVDISMNIKI